jgi:hypothetical protein
VKGAALVLAVLLMLSGDHVTLHTVGGAVSVPVPVLVLIAELGACVMLGRLIWRARPFCLHWHQQGSTP